MSTTTKCLLSFFLGVGVSAIVTFGLLEEKHKRELEYLAEEYFGEDLHYKRETPDTEEMTDEQYNAMTYQRSDRPRTQYHTIAKPSLDEVANQTLTNEPDDIEVISLEEYAQPDPGIDRVTLYYYEDDDTVCGEDEQVVGAPEELIGDVALDMFGEKSDDADVVYVRNNRIATDFEVIRLHKSYKKEILGQDDV